MPKYNSLLVLYLLFLSVALYGQESKYFSISSDINISQLIKHNSEINATPPASKGIDITISKKTYGKRYWHHSFHFPLIGLKLSYCNIDQNQKYGQAFGINPNVTFSLFQSKKIKNTLELGWGIAYLTKKYDAIRNPENIVIGSHFNTILNLKYKLHYEINPKHHFNIGFDFKHYSNGGSLKPNLGINIAGASLGYVYSPFSLDKDNIQATPKTTNHKRWRYIINSYIAFTELADRDQSRYPIYINRIARAYLISPIQEASISIDYEFKKAIYQKLINDNQSKKFARQKSTRLGVSLNYELILGLVGIQAGIGTYIPKYNYQALYPVYFKIGMNYYIPIFSKVNLYLSTSVKTHTGVAEYFAFGLGCKF